MSKKFTIKANDDFTPPLVASFLFVKDMTIGKSIRLIASGDGVSLDYEIEKGSKIGPIDSTLTEWHFINDNSVDVDIELRVGQVAYDELKIVGDINALTRFDNLTIDGNQYTGGYSQVSSTGNYSRVLLFNPAASLSTIFVKSLSISCSSNDYVLAKETSTASLLNWTNILSMKQNKKSGDPNGEGIIYAGVLDSLTSATVDIISYNPSHTGGGLSSFDYKNAPIEVLPGEGLIVIAGSVSNNLSCSFNWEEVIL